MDILQLRYFQAVAQYQNFTHAAESLFITQSALSKSISHLEEELKLKLFERNGNRIYLSRFGSAFLERINQTLMELESSVLRVQEMAGLEYGQVRIATSTEVFIKHLIKNFLLDYSKTTFVCKLQSVEQIERSLGEGSIDFAVSCEPITGNGIVWQPLFEDYLSVLIHKANPLSNKECVFLEELANDNFVCGNLDFDTESPTVKLCEKAGFTPHILYSGYDIDLPQLLVAQNLGVLITPYSVTKGVQCLVPENNDIKIVPLADKLQNKTIGIAAKRGHFQSKAALEFYDRTYDFFVNLM